MGATLNARRFPSATHETAPSGQIAAQWPHEQHRCGRATLACWLSRASTELGHTRTHLPQPMQALWSMAVLAVTCLHSPSQEASR